MCLRGFRGQLIGIINFVQNGFTISAIKNYVTVCIYYRRNNYAPRHQGGSIEGLLTPLEYHSTLWYRGSPLVLHYAERHKPLSHNLFFPTKVILTHLCPPFGSTFAVRETASLGIMGEPRVPPINPSETIVLSEHYRL